MGHQPIQPWFADAILTGLQRLYSLSLQGCPAAESLPLTAETWATSLWNVSNWQPDDAPRLESAFRYLGLHCDRWPPPKRLLEAMPNRPPVLSLELKRTPEEIELGRQKVRDLVNTLAAKKGPL